MKLVEYRETLIEPLRQATLCLLVKDDKILLAMKKRGFGKGRWNGVGGKSEQDETVEKALLREAQEEIGVTPTSYHRVATLNFYFPHQPNFNQQVCVFLVEEWEGKPTETEEMRPQWFKKDEIPFDSMWSDDKHWLPKVLEGLVLKADFMFKEGDKLSDFELLEGSC